MLILLITSPLHIIKFICCTDFFELIILMNTQLNVLLGKLGTLIGAFSKTAEVAISATLGSILLVNKDVLIVHAIVVIFESHDTSLEWRVLIDRH